MSAAPTIPIGTLLAARWIVGAPLGLGENGEVHEVEEAQGGRLCAVKILDPSFRRGGPAWSSFQSEVRTVSALPVEGVARVYDLGIDGKLHRPFIVGERVMFPSLARLVAERGPLPPHVAASALLTLARALDAMHAAHVAHGALKPQNVFVSPENPNWARLTDYGLSRLKAALDPQHATLGWTPPELTRGGVPEPAGDRFALSLVTFFALTGMPWFSALGTRGASRPDDWGTLASPASVRARELGGALDSAFDLWFRAALAGDPASRYSSATEMAHAFSGIVQSLAAAQGGPLSGPGVVSAVAQPLVFRRNLPQAEPSFEPAPDPLLAEQPRPSEVHPFSPTVAMPAMAAPPVAARPQPVPAQQVSLGGTLVMPPPAASPVTPPPDPTSLGGTLVVQPSTSPFAPVPAEFDATYPVPVPAPPLPLEAPPPMPVPAFPAYAAEPPAQGRPLPGRTFPKGAVIGLFIAASLAFMAFTVAAVVLLRQSDPEPAASAAASAAAPPATASALEKAPPVSPPAPTPVAAAATGERPEPAPAPDAPAPAKPSVAAAAPAPKPAAAKPATVSTAAKPTTAKPATTKPSTTKPTTAKPAKKKCGTFIPCK